MPEPRLLTPCPYCGKDLAEHEVRQFAALGTVIICEAVPPGEWRPVVLGPPEMPDA